MMVRTLYFFIIFYSFGFLLEGTAVVRTYRNCDAAHDQATQPLRLGTLSLSLLGGAQALILSTTLVQRTQNYTTKKISTPEHADQQAVLSEDDGDRLSALASSFTFSLGTLLPN